MGLMRGWIVRSKGLRDSRRRDGFAAMACETKVGGDDASHDGFAVVGEGMDYYEMEQRLTEMKRAAVEVGLLMGWMDRTQMWIRFGIIVLGRTAQTNPRRYGSTIHR